jgi:hypothetical protein
MKTLKESLLSNIEDNLTTGNDFVKGLDNEITNIQKNIIQIKNWSKESRFNQLIETRLYIGLDARRILEFLGIPASMNRISVVVEYLGKWPMGSNGKKHYNIYIGADISGTKPIYRKNEIQVASSMTHIKFIKQYVLPCFNSLETLKKLYDETNK